MTAHIKIIHLSLASLICFSANIKAADSFTWNCQASADGKGWVCTDPGQAVNENMTKSSASEPPKDTKVPASPANITTAIPDQPARPDVFRSPPLPEKYCRTSSSMANPVSTARTDGITEVEADDVLLDEKTAVSTFNGDVRLDYSDQTVLADHLTYNNNTRDLEAAGDMTYKQTDIAFKAKSASLNLDTRKGHIEQALYRLPLTRARGSAEVIHLRGEGITAYENITYTTCKADNNDWVFNATEMKTNQNTGVGTAKNMSIYFKNVPIMYFPYASFPIDDRRKSGFLTPSFGGSQKTGTEVTVPYYLNLAPNYDATITPRIMSKRGILLNGEFRHINEYSQTTFKGEIIPNDNDYTQSGNRGAANLAQNFNITDRLNASLDLNYASDATYLEDFGQSIDSTSTQHLERTATLKYQGSHFSIDGIVQEYQTLDQTIALASRPYRRLPQITLSGSQTLAESDFTGFLDVQYTNFDHAINVEGQRIDIAPKIEYDWRRSWGFLSPGLALRHTSYDLKRQAAGVPATINRSTGTLTLDGGLYFDRDSSWLGEKAVHTLEPRLFYVRTPYKDQSNIPVFDTSLVDFSIDNLFRDNRFSGPDRIGDANQLTLALTSRMLNATNNREIFSLTIGQILYFSDRKVQLPGAATITDNNSAIVTALNANLTNHWRAQADLQWDPDLTEKTLKSSVRLAYRDADKHLFTARYHFNRPSSLEYYDISTYWPVAFNTRLLAHVNYSLHDNRNIESVAGIEYGSSCCWRLRAIARQYQINAADGDNLMFMLQLELSGFAKFGDDIDDFLERNIDGFVRDN